MIPPTTPTDVPTIPPEQHDLLDHRVVRDPWDAHLGAIGQWQCTQPVLTPPQKGSQPLCPFLMGQLEQIETGFATIRCLEVVDIGGQPAIFRLKVPTKFLLSLMVFEPVEKPRLVTV